MNQNLKKIIVIYLIVISIGGVLPFVFLSQHRLQISLDIIRTISILATSIFALLYFDPLGIKKKNTEKQYENVIKILDLIIGQKILIESFSETSKTYFQFLIKKTRVINAFTKEGDIKYIKDYPVIFYLNNLIDSHVEIIKLKNNLWTPIEISKHLEFLDFGSGEFRRPVKEPYAKIHWANVKMKEKDDEIEYLNGKKYTVFDLMENYKNLIISCETWLDQNSFSKRSLNI